VIRKREKGKEKRSRKKAGERGKAAYGPAQPKLIG